MRAVHKEGGNVRFLQKPDHPLNVSDNAATGNSCPRKSDLQVKADQSFSSILIMTCNLDLSAPGLKPVRPKLAGARVRRNSRTKTTCFPAHIRLVLRLSRVLVANQLKFLSMNHLHVKSSLSSQGQSGLIKPDQVIF